MDMFWAELLKAGIGLVSLALTSLLGLAFKWLLGKIKNEKIQQFFSKLETVTYTVVSGLEQTMRQELAKAHEDGKLTAEDYAALKNAALEQICNAIPNTYVDAVKSEIPNLHDFIAQQIEAAVRGMKRYE
jgi:hypothetical protein